MVNHQQKQAHSYFRTRADEKTPFSEVTKPTNEVQQGSIAQETAKRDSLPLVFKNSEPIREDQIQNAIKFLSHPRVRGSPVIHRRSFLERKGLTKEEIDEAFRRVPDPPLSSQTTVNSRDRQEAASNVHRQGQIHALQPTHAPLVMVSPPSFLSRFRWYHAALAVGVLSASGAGTAVFLKKSLIPKLKLWVRRIMLEEETDPLKKADAKPRLAEEAVAAAIAASAAASNIARVSQEMMKTKREEMKYFEDLMHLLGVQVQEMRSLSYNISKLEGNYSKKDYSADREDYSGSVKTAAERDMPPNPNQHLSNPRIVPTIKPCDYGKAPQAESSTGLWGQQKNPRSTDFGYETIGMRSIGNQKETNKMEPPSLQKQRLWFPPQSPPVFKPEAAEAIRSPKPQAKVDQEAAAIDDQLGVSDELQNITTLPESGGDGVGILQDVEIQEETEQEQIRQEGN